MELEPITHLEKSIAGTVAPVTHLEKVIEQYGGGGGGGAETVVEVSGTTPTIEPQTNTIYNCGELTSLTISNPPATGKYSIIFFSGATATATVGIENFAAEANKRYKIKVEDNYATYDSWPYTQA